MTNRRSTQGRPWLAVGVVLGLLAAPGGAAAGAVPRTADPDSARHWLVLNFDTQPVGRQIAQQGNAALQRIRAGIRITAPALPRPQRDELASRRAQLDG